MTQKEILEKLIAHYTKSIFLCQNAKSLKEVDIRLFNNKVHKGICLAANFILNQNIYTTEWVMRYHKRNYYWFKRPCDEETKSKKISALQYRLDKMKEILSTLK